MFKWRSVIWAFLADGPLVYHCWLHDTKLENFVQMRIRMTWLHINWNLFNHSRYVGNETTGRLNTSEIKQRVHRQFTVLINDQYWLGCSMFRTFRSKMLYLVYMVLYFYMKKVQSLTNGTTSLTGGGSVGDDCNQEGFTISQKNIHTWGHFYPWETDRFRMPKNFRVRTRWLLLFLSV